MRVLHVLHSLSHGGQERVVLDLVQSASSAVQAHVLVGCPGGPLEEAIRSAGGAVHHLEGATRRARRRHLREIVASLRPDVVHAHNAWGIHLCAEALQRRHRSFGLVATRHGQWLPAGRLGRLRYRLASGRFDAVVSVSEAAAASAIAAGVLSPITSHVIPNGIDLTRFAPNRPERTSACEAVYVGRLEPVKGLRVLLEAAVLVQGRRPETRLTVVGGGSEAGPLRTFATSLGLDETLDFTGPVMDVLPYLHRASVGVLPSYSEGISISLLEMMASGLPVVATTVGGTPEILEHGHSGLLVPPGDPVALAEAILALLDDPGRAARMADVGRAVVGERYSLVRMTERYEDLYRQCRNRDGEANA